MPPRDDSRSFRLIAVLVLMVAAPQILWSLSTSAITGTGGHSQLAIVLLIVLLGAALYHNATHLLSAVDVQSHLLEVRTQQEVMAHADQLAAALGMQHDPDPVDGHPTLVGRRETAWVRVHLSAEPFLVVSHRLPLAAGLRVEAGGGGLPVGNPVLDGALRITGAGGLDWHDTELTGLLMEALHAHPTAWLSDTTLSLPVDDLEVETINARIDLALELTAALRRCLT